MYCVSHSTLQPVLGPTYERDGKYQTSDSIDELRRAWGPEAMLPRMFRDREVREAAAAPLKPP